MSSSHYGTASAVSLEDIWSEGMLHGFHNPSMMLLNKPSCKKFARNLRTLVPLTVFHHYYGCGQYPVPLVNIHVWMVGNDTWPYYEHIFVLGKPCAVSWEPQTCAKNASTVVAMCTATQLAIEVYILSPFLVTYSQIYISKSH